MWTYLCRCSMLHSQLSTSKHKKCTFRTYKNLALYFLNLVEVLNYFCGRGFNIPGSSPRTKQPEGRSNLDLLCLTTSLSGKPAATILDAGQPRASVPEVHEEALGSWNTGSVLGQVPAKQALRASSSLSCRSGWHLILDNKPAGSRKHLWSCLKY